MRRHPNATPAPGFRVKITGTGISEPNRYDRLGNFGSEPNEEGGIHGNQ